MEQCGVLFYTAGPQTGVVLDIFSTDRNVRSKCRCSNVSCSSHYDAQLTAFFIDPRAKNSDRESHSWGRSRFSNGRNLNAEFIRSQRDCKRRTHHHTA
ncbi:unnamed protein product [Danaus chrysippus]|uniref:(African queen) hypothetical protein n=1 Tax=Danaus chrysippus TaxID=151541 RepID=A0A8J2QVP1_9NEOP|nr:unnamed protein product [Danaus chrysippus]